MLVACAVCGLVGTFQVVLPAKYEVAKSGQIGSWLCRSTTFQVVYQEIKWHCNFWNVISLCGLWWVVFRVAAQAWIWVWTQCSQSSGDFCWGNAFCLSQAAKAFLSSNLLCETAEIDNSSARKMTCEPLLQVRVVSCCICKHKLQANEAH